MSVLDRLKATMHIGSLDMKEKIDIELSFTEKIFVIHFMEPLTKINLQEIQDAFFPFVSIDNRIIKMNYIYIKTIYLDGANLLKFTIYNPLTTSIFTVIFNHFKLKKKVIFSKSIPSSHFMNSIISEIKKKQKVQIMKNIKNFINVIQIFYDFRSTQRKYNKIANEIFLKSFIYGLRYYDKSMKEYKLGQEKIKLIPKEINKEINKSIIDIRTQLAESINIPQENSSSDFRHNIENQNLVLPSDENSELGIDSISQKDLFQNYPEFAKFPSEIKEKTSYYTEVTINLIYKLININHEYLNFKFSEINVTDNGFIINRRNMLSNFGQNEINKIIDNNNKKNSENEIELEEKINKWFEFCKEFHAFVPNNSIENIVNNSSEIIQRKFFEILFRTFFSNVFTIEAKKNKTLTSDEFHNILKIIRRIKKILFNENNKEYYSDFDFLNEKKDSFNYENNITY